MMPAVLLLSLAVYLACGVVFALPFAVMGVQRVDPHAVHGSWGFRLLIFPGVIALWPLLLKRWVSGQKQAPEERNAHRLAAKEKPYLP